ncbi:glucosaminidase domain-containing protein [Paenibacillus nasutitermitis]|uniref:Mannosyl-glycoprotein endo-beta-N-acetylglucosaminidase n=1 Tax=Paenibacillus nasutitermitis TaxID=1652958 RepID=A0A916YVN5_9BACL|nr:glucosaminidase domain-containing protein [Paenibacillus nasutitermitis]GGD63635.1 hypothetical protein GCM10010911_21730 [Paenibacillus nasutitermitis]
MPSNAAHVLTKSEISNIRHYVQHKYADLPTERRAEIVADAMQRIVLRQLPAFAEEIRLRLTHELLRQVVAGQQRPVGPEHIFHGCLALNLEDSAISEPLYVWTQQRLGSALSLKAFNKLMTSAKQMSGEAAAEEATAWSVFATEALLQGDSRDKPEADMMAEVIPLLPAAGQRSVKSMLYTLLSALLIGSTLVYSGGLLKPAPAIDQPVQNAAAPAAVSPVEVLPANGLPPELRYTKVDENRLKQYLLTKSSLLAEPPYFKAILSTAKEKNIHPLLLFAITGQEQAFVPTTHKQAKEIANNPFNVFHSWKDYNTTIEQSAAIAARTILRISKDRPDGADAITWINREYAEDPNWSKGVRSILTALKRYVEL